MKIRETTYRDYGFEQGEQKKLLEYCRGPDFGVDDAYLMRQCAIAANGAIADQLYVSITQGISYDRLFLREYIPMPKQDFYGYRRLCLSIFRNFLIFLGEWK